MIKIEHIGIAVKGRKNKPMSEKGKENIRLAHIGKKLLPEHKRKIRLNAKRGRDNFQWKGGVTPIHNKIRGTCEYKLWRKAVFTRDNYTCVWCGSKNGEGKTIVLNADHIKPFAMYPELRFAIDNGRTLCVPCHKTTDTYGSKTTKLIK